MSSIIGGGKAKMEVVGISISKKAQEFNRLNDPNSRQIGHHIHLLATLKVTPRKAGSTSTEIDQPQLEWKEQIDFYKLGPDGKTWVLDKTAAGNTSGKYEDKYKKNPTSNTFKFSYTHRFMQAIDDPIRNPAPVNPNLPANAAYKALNDEVKPKLTNDLRDNAAKQWMAAHGYQWTIGIRDTPLLGRGEAGKEVAKRRVLYFDLGLKGSTLAGTKDSPRVTATQILEVNATGQTTINKFFIPAITNQVAEEATNLARWRTQVNAATETFLP